MAVGLVAAAAPAPAATTGFSDSFSGTKLDLSRWRFVANSGCNSASNAKVSGGYLHLISTKQHCGVRIGTRQTFQYGQITARIYFDLQQGAHPAMVMYGATGNWPWKGEVDIAEEIGRQPNTDHVRVWTQQLGLTTKQRCGVPLDFPVTVNHAWHTYGINWQPGSITFLLDGRVIWYWAAWEAKARGCSYPFDGPNYRGRIDFVSAVGGPYAGPPPANGTGYPLDTRVDYLKVVPAATG
jgi:beta-glucanase (GH16 family)